MILSRIETKWRTFWLGRAGSDSWRKPATWLASLGVPPYKARIKLAWMHPNGYIAANAELLRTDLELGEYVFIGNRVAINRQGNGARVALGFGVELHSGCTIEVFENGGVTIGEKTAIQSRCSFVSAAAPIRIGSRVQIAQLCGLYSFDHGFAPGTSIYEQPMQSKGPIVIGDDAWLGFNVTVLSGVKIGQGAVIGAGSVVNRDIPENAIAVGVPAKIIRFRSTGDSQLSHAKGV